MTLKLLLIHAEFVFWCCAWLALMATGWHQFTKLLDLLIEELEDLYWSITNGASSVNSLIDDYLNKDFAEEKLKGAWYPNPEEIPF